MFYQDIPEQGSPEDNDEVEVYRDVDRDQGDNYYSDIGNMANYSFSSPPSRQRNPEQELLRYFLARGMRPQQALISTRAVLSGEPMRKTAEEDDDKIPKASLKKKLTYGGLGALAGAASQGIFKPTSPRRMLAGALLGGVSGYFTPDNPALGLGLGAGSLALLRSANVGNLMRHVDTSKLDKAQKGVQDALALAGRLPDGARKEILQDLRALPDAQRTPKALAETIRSFLSKAKDGYKAQDVLSDAGDPRLTSMFSQYLPSWMGGIKNTRITGATPASGIMGIFNSAPDVTKVNLSGLSGSNLTELENLASGLEAVAEKARFKNNPLAAISINKNKYTLGSKAVAAVKGLSELQPAMAKEIVRGSGLADRAAAHIGAPLLAGAAGSMIGEAMGHWISPRKAYGATSALRDAGNAISGTLSHNVREDTGFNALRNHMDRNYGRYLVGAAATLPLAAYYYNQPTREELRIRGRI
jgi:hypothetical protein